MPEKVSDIKRQKSIARSSGWSCAQMPRATYCHRDKGPGAGGGSAADGPPVCPAGGGYPEDPPPEGGGGGGGNQPPPLAVVAGAGGPVTGCTTPTPGATAGREL